MSGVWVGRVSGVWVRVSGVSGVWVRGEWCGVSGVWGG